MTDGTYRALVLQQNDSSQLILSNTGGNIYITPDPLPDPETQNPPSEVDLEFVDTVPDTDISTSKIDCQIQYINWNYDNARYDIAFMVNGINVMPLGKFKQSSRSPIQLDYVE